MTAFVLVHGSGQNAGCWSRVAAGLRERGHATIAPELPKQKPEWGMEDYAAVIADAIDGPGVVVVAHSLSGIFLPVVAGLRDCGLLVFLAAVIPEPGKSVREQLAEDPAMFNPEWIEAGPRWFDESQKESLAREFLFHDCDGETLDWALNTVEPIDPGTLSTQPAPFANWADVPTASIVATEDRTLSPDWIRRASRRNLGKEAIGIYAGHSPHVSQAGRVTSILVELAEGARDGGKQDETD